MLVHPLDAGALVEESEVRVRLAVLTRLRLFTQPFVRQEAEHVESVGQETTTTPRRARAEASNSFSAVQPDWYAPP